MKKISLLFLVILANSMIRAQSVDSTPYNLMLKALLTHSVNEINVDKASELEDVIFIDAREKNEYEVSHIKDAIWVGYNNQDLKPIKKIDKQATIIVYCSVGYRSEKTAEKLNQKGYKDVYNLYGGIFEWKNKNLPIYQNNSQTEKIHAYNKVWGVWISKGEKIYD
jgi:rhodanese-related sulfurtransferase